MILKPHPFLIYMYLIKKYIHKTRALESTYPARFVALLHLGHVTLTAQKLYISNNGDRSNSLSDNANSLYIYTL